MLLLDLFSNYEEKGKSGIRIEIRYNHIIILKMNKVVLETPFKVEKVENKYFLRLKDNKLRNPKDHKEYAKIRSLYFYKRKLMLLTIHPGIKDELAILEKVRYSRYGDYKIEDKLIKNIQGKWLSETNTFSFEINDNVLTYLDKEMTFHVLKSKDNKYYIRDIDPSNYYVFDFGTLEIVDDLIYAHMRVHNATPQMLVFRRKDLFL